MGGLDFPALCGRLLSASYMPQEGHPNYVPMMAAMQELFDRHQQEGTVVVDYDTRVYFGHVG